MKTFPERLQPIINKIYYSRLLQMKRDIVCLFFGHKKYYIGDYQEVCSRCNRFVFNGHGEQFYHNWEMCYGRFARCHDHSMHE